MARMKITVTGVLVSLAAAAVFAQNSTSSFVPQPILQDLAFLEKRGAKTKAQRMWPRAPLSPNADNAVQRQQDEDSRKSGNNEHI
jgi:hypothetical protein